MSDDLTDTQLLRENVEAMAAAFTAGARPSRVRPWVSTRLEQDVRAVAEFEQYGQQYTFRCDEAVERGGRGSAPSPMRYLLSGIAFCLQGWTAKSCALRGLRLDALQVDVRTLLDMRGEHLVDDVPPHPQWFVLDVALETPAAGEPVLKAVQDAVRRCPVTSLVTQAVPVHLVVRHNGTLIHDARPDSLRAEHEEALTR